MAPARLLVCFLYIFCLPGIAYAYVDPGSGMLLLQGLVAAVGALLFAIRNPMQFFRNLKKHLRRNRPQ